MRCSDCDERLTLSDKLNDRMRIAHNFELNFNVCSYKKNFYSSKQYQRIEKTKGGRQTFKVNIRDIIAIREISCGEPNLLAC